MLKKSLSYIVLFASLGTGAQSVFAATYKEGLEEGGEASAPRAPSQYSADSEAAWQALQASWVRERDDASRAALVSKLYHIAQKPDDPHRLDALSWLLGSPPSDALALPILIRLAQESNARQWGAIKILYHWKKVGPLPQEIFETIHPGLMKIAFDNQDSHQLDAIYLLNSPQVRPHLPQSDTAVFRALMQIAAEENHPKQWSAIQTLGAMQQTLSPEERNAVRSLVTKIAKNFDNTNQLAAIKALSHASTDEGKAAFASVHSRMIQIAQHYGNPHQKKAIDFLRMESPDPADRALGEALLKEYIQFKKDANPE